MRIDPQLWLGQAKAMPIGKTQRIRLHGDGRPNTVVGNDVDRWWCYCQKRKEGGVVMKDHVLVTGAKAPASSTMLDLPRDRVRVLSMDAYAAQAIAGLLARKGMDMLYLPELWFSEDRKRLLMQTHAGWLGRDTTGNSPQKWLSYSRTLYLQSDSGSGDFGVVVEDPFSFYKVSWALRGTDATVFCALGTEVRDSMALALIRWKSLLFFMDGDDAGHRGAAKGAKKMRGLGCEAKAKCAPTGYDPKDLTIKQIREHVWN